MIGYRLPEESSFYAYVFREVLKYENRQRVVDRRFCIYGFAKAWVEVQA